MQILIFTLLLAAFFLIHPPAALAHCPLCVAGAGAGLSLSRVLGIDDTITGIWMAAFLGAMSLWASNSIKKKFISFQDNLIYLSIFVLTILSFYRFGLINEHNGLIFNLPKLTFGMLVGGILFYVVDKLNAFIKKKNDGVLFPYMPIVFSLGSILIASIITFVVLNYFV